MSKSKFGMAANRRDTRIKPYKPSKEFKGTMLLLEQMMNNLDPDRKKAQIKLKKICDNVLGKKSEKKKTKKKTG